MEAREREHVMRELGHEDEEVRRLAVERLSTLRPEEAIPSLIEALGDPGWRVRKAAIDRLAASPELSQTTRSLVVALADGENPGRRNAALEALVRTGSAAVPILLEATRDADVDVRKQVVDVLAGIGDPMVSPRLIELLGDSDPNVRAAAADGLGNVGPEEAAVALLALVRRDAEPLVRLSGLRAVARLEVSVPVAEVAALLDDGLVRSAALGVLGYSDDPSAFDALTKALEHPARSAREAAVDAILAQSGRVPAGQLDAFAGRLREGFEAPEHFMEDALERVVEGPLAVRLSLVQFFGLLRLTGSVEPLLCAGQDEALGEIVIGALEGFGSEAEQIFDEKWDDLSLSSRVLACQVMGRTAGSIGGHRLRAALVAPDPALRLAAARAIGGRQMADALPELIGRLEAVEESGFDLDDEDETQTFVDSIAQVVSGAGDDTVESAIELLMARLAGASETYRLATTGLLGRIGRPQDLDQVALLLSDPSDRVRRAATAALGHVAPRETEPLRHAMADESATVRMGAAAALAATGDSEVIADLASLADDEDVRVRGAAMRAVGVWAAAQRDDGLRERALSMLAAGLGLGGPVAMAALESLTRLGGAGVVSLVREVLADPDAELVQAALACIGEHGTRDDVESTIPMFGHDHWAVRGQAVQIAGNRKVAHAVPAMLRRLDIEQDEFVRDALLRALEVLETHAG